VLGWSWSEQQAGSSSMGGGGGAGKVSMGDFRFTMSANQATPKLALACATGDHIPKAVLTCRKAGKDQQEYLTITLSEVLVSCYQSGGSASSNVVPLDQFSLNYAKIEWEYRPQKADGTLGAPVKAGFGLKANRKM
jgi:type VI secretion system secreted protein Hcp